MRIHRAYRFAITVGLAAGSAACGDTARPGATGSADVRVSVRTGVITAPDSVPPGWRRLRVDETEGEHIVIVFRMPPGATAGDVATFVAALDTAPATPSPGVAVGGPEVGAQGEVIVHLTPGLHVLACVSRGAGGHRHAGAGESRILHVRSATVADSSFAAPPPSAETVRLADFAYLGPDHWAPGPHLLRIENTGRQDHQLRLARLRDGASLQTWMTADDPDTVATAIVGVARVGAGEVAYVPVALAPGSYVAYCLVADATTRRPHVALGMLRAIQVP